MTLSESGRIDLPPLSAARIPELPESFYYIPNFLSTHEQATLLSKIPSNRWTHLAHRRLQAHPSTLTANNRLISAPMPPWLTTSPPILQRFKDVKVFEGAKHGGPNHCLVNEYTPGSGIMPHEDGAAYEPVVATVSLGGTIVLDIYSKSPSSDVQHEIQTSRPAPKWRILQEPGSLLVTTGEAYSTLLHGIGDVEVDENLGADTVANWSLLDDTSAFKDGKNQRTTRVSLTYRDVIKYEEDENRVKIQRIGYPID